MLVCCYKEGPMSPLVLFIFLSMAALELETSIGGVVVVMTAIVRESSYIILSSLLLMRQEESVV